MDRRYGYNFESGGSKNKHMSAETRQKMSEQKKGKYAGANNPMYGKSIPCSEERKKMLQMYKDLTGEKLYRKKVPDYIKHEELNENTIKKKDLSNNIKIYKEGTLSTKSNYLNLNTQP